MERYYIMLKVRKILFIESRKFKCTAKNKSNFLSGKYIYIFDLLNF